MNLTSLPNDKIFLPTHYQRMAELIVERTSKAPQETNVLELGCYSGYLVTWLRQKGYLAEGLDGNLSNIKQRGVTNLHHAEVTDLDQIFPNQLFDMIVLQEVLTNPAQMEYRFGMYGAIFLMYSTQKEREETGLSISRTIDQTLENCFRHLSPRGFLIDLENPCEPQGYSIETVLRIGYRVEKFEIGEIILQKP